LADLYYKTTSLNPIPRKYSTTTIQKLISIILQQKKNKLVEILEQIKSYATTKNFSDKTTTIFHFAFFLWQLQKKSKHTLNWFLYLIYFKKFELNKEMAFWYWAFNVRYLFDFWWNQEVWCWMLSFEMSVFMPPKLPPTPLYQIKY